MLWGTTTRFLPILGQACSLQLVLARVRPTSSSCRRGWLVDLGCQKRISQIHHGVVPAVQESGKRATDERSHYYVGRCVSDAINEMTALRRRLRPAMKPPNSVAELRLTVNVELARDPGRGAAPWRGTSAKLNARSRWLRDGP